MPRRVADQLRLRVALVAGLALLRVLRSGTGWRGGSSTASRAPRQLARSSKTGSIRIQLPPASPSLAIAAQAGSSTSSATRQCSLGLPRRLEDRAEPDERRRAERREVLAAEQPQRARARRVRGEARRPSASARSSGCGERRRPAGRRRIAVRIVACARGARRARATSAAGRRSRAIAVASSSTGRSVRSARSPRRRPVGGSAAMLSPSASPAASSAPNVVAASPTNGASSAATRRSARPSLRRRRATNPRRSVRGAASVASTRCRPGSSVARSCSSVSLTSPPRPASASPKLADEPCGSPRGPRGRRSGRPRRCRRSCVAFSQRRARPSPGIVRALRPGTSSTYLPPSTEPSRTSARRVDRQRPDVAVELHLEHGVRRARRRSRGTASIFRTWPTRAPPMRTSAFLTSLPASGTATVTS